MFDNAGSSQLAEKLRVTVKHLFMTALPAILALWDVCISRWLSGAQYWLAVVMALALLPPPSGFFQLLSAFASALGSLEIILPEKHAMHRSYNTATAENKQQRASSNSPCYPS